MEFGVVAGSSTGVVVEQRAERRTRRWLILYVQSRKLYASAVSGGLDGADQVSCATVSVWPGDRRVTSSWGAKPFVQVTTTVGSGYPLYAGLSAVDSNL